MQDSSGDNEDTVLHESRKVKHRFAQVLTNHSNITMQLINFIQTDCLIGLAECTDPGKPILWVFTE